MNTKELFLACLEKKGYTRKTEETNIFDKTYEVLVGDFIRVNGNKVTEVLPVDIYPELAGGHFWFEFKDSNDNNRWGNLYKGIIIVEVVNNIMYLIDLDKAIDYLLENITNYFETYIPTTKDNRGDYVLGYAIPVNDLLDIGIAKELAR